MLRSCSVTLTKRSSPPVGAHDVQLAIVPLISGIRVEFQVHVGILGKTKFLFVAVPVSYANEKFFDVIVRGIHAEVSIIDVELQHSVMHE
jgi:hypothetical protein